MAEAGNDAAVGSFLPGTHLPRRRSTLTDPRLGMSGRALAEALFDRDVARVERLATADRELLRLPVGDRYDMLSVAIATGEPTLIDLLLRLGAPADGRQPGLPLELAICALEPTLALLLLQGGASPSPRGRPVGPLRAAITINSLGAVELLLDHGADVNAHEVGGRRALHIALLMQTFRIAELLLDRGADPWAIDEVGINLGSAVMRPTQNGAVEEEAARSRLLDRLVQLGWPDPPPSPARVLELAAARRWRTQG